MVKQIDRIIAERWATLYYYRRMLRLPDAQARKQWTAMVPSGQYLSGKYFDFTFSFFPNKADSSVEELRQLYPYPDYYGDIEALHPSDRYLNQLGPIRDYLMGDFNSIIVDVETWFRRMQ